MSENPYESPREQGAGRSFDEFWRPRIPFIQGLTVFCLTISAAMQAYSGKYLLAAAFLALAFHPAREIFDDLRRKSR